MFSAVFSYRRISTVLYDCHPLHMDDCHGRLTGIVICEELSSSILSSSFNASAVALLADIYPNLNRGRLHRECACSIGDLSLPAL